ncbi:PQQ-dependent sugar dehydrogenase [Candidatus Parcubacteria bacterium]|nr:PQQ-dependent sugar dehydrogenase [Candidatus Parcubacteria bacterium]
MKLGTKQAWAAGIILILGLSIGGYVALKRPPAAPSANLPPAPSPPSAAGPQVVVSNLDTPWAIEFAPDGRLFLSERGGRVRVVKNGRLQPEPVARIEVAEIDEGGLLGLALDPDFRDNSYIYLYHAYRSGGRILNRVVRLTERDGRAGGSKVILDNIPGARFHDGGRIKFGPDRKLYVTTGDALQPELAQDRASLAGKILRLNADGSVPNDNPFPGSPVFSLGHRNPQGLAWHPETGDLFATEHGPQAHDEVNLIKPGANYGWPRHVGKVLSPAFDPAVADYRDPVIESGNTTWAPSGAAFADGLLFAGLRSRTLWQLTLRDNQRAGDLNARLQDRFGRLRDVAVGPDGSIYLATGNRDGRGTPAPEDDRIIRLKP